MDIRWSQSQVSFRHLVTIRCVWELNSHEDVKSDMMVWSQSLVSFRHLVTIRCVWGSDFSRGRQIRHRWFDTPASNKNLSEADKWLRPYHLCLIWHSCEKSDPHTHLIVKFLLEAGVSNRCKDCTVLILVRCKNGMILILGRCQHGMVLILGRCQHGMVLILGRCWDGMVLFLGRSWDGMV